MQVTNRVPFYINISKTFQTRRWNAKWNVCMCPWRVNFVQNKRDSLSYLISSLTPRLARKLFIEVHDVSKMPIKRNTPSKISRIVSGGALSERISARASLRMSETAARASAKSGSISAISWSMPFLLKVWKKQSKTQMKWTVENSQVESVKECGSLLIREDVINGARKYRTEGKVEWMGLLPEGIQGIRLRLRKV